MIDMRRSIVTICLTLGFASAMVPIRLAAAERTSRFALILTDEPAAKAKKAGGRRDAPEVVAARQQIGSKQAVLRSQLEAKGFHVTGATSVLLNAVYVNAPASQVAALRAMPGVRAVFPIRVQRLNLNAAVNLVSAPQAWTVLGGTTNAGAGIKIGIIDTGIDQTHPAFQDSTLTAPANYPPAGQSPNVPAFTNSKVIVARSYTSYEVSAQGTGPAFSTPDDTTPRDRVGHGTAVAMCAGGNTNAGPLATITGLAPKAYLGNYKVFGSPGIIDGAYTDAIVMALEDAYTDGMNVVNISLGGPAFSAPLETGSFCQDLFGSSQCDPEALAVQTAVTNDMVVVTAAGNEGDDGYFEGSPTFDTVGSPAYAPGAIAAAATGNSHMEVQAIHIAGANVPANLTTVAAIEDASSFLTSVVTAPIIDAASVGDVYGCNSFPVNSMNGDIALIERGGVTTACTFETKLANAYNAGAIAVIFYNNGQTPDLITVAGDDTLIPSFFIGTSDGQAVKAYIDATPGATASLDAVTPAFAPSDDTNEVTIFSSRGPALGYGLKPEVAAPGENIYTAAQSYDPNGEVYDPSGYVAVSGTSFSSPITAGIAAMVRQANPAFTATQVKSAIVNTATSDTTDPYTTAANVPLGVLSVGGGKVSAINAISTNVTVEPATISFGALSGGVSATQPLTITNFSAATVALTVGVTRTVPDTATQLTVSTSVLTLTAAGTSGAVATVNVALSGTAPVPGIYQGTITIAGGAQTLHVPYLYLVGDGVPYDFISLAGDDAIGSFPGTVNDAVSDGFSAFRIVDQYGVPVANLPVSWSALTGNGSSVQNADTQTDQYGQAFAEPILGSVPETYTYRVTVTGMNLGDPAQNYYDFTDDAVDPATIGAGGVVNAASNALGQGIAPGSYISIYGTALAAGSFGAGYTPLPISIDYTSVGFDGTGVSVPGALGFVSPGQVNVQVPWELAGQSSVQIKVDNEPNFGNLITVPVTTYSPAVFVVNGIAAATVALTGVIVTADAPVTRGQYVALYCNGLGPVSNQPATGAVAPGGASLATNPVFPTVTIGGQPTTVQFSGLAPGFVGLYQVNVLVPAGIPAGEQEVVLTIGGIASPAVNLPVQ